MNYWGKVGNEGSEVRDGISEYKGKDASCLSYNFIQFVEKINICILNISWFSLFLPFSNLYIFVDLILTKYKSLKMTLNL